MALEQIKAALATLWAARPPHLHRVELLTTVTPHGRVDLDCNWAEDVTLEQRLAELGGDASMVDRYLRDRDLVGKSNATVVARRLHTETKHLYFAVGDAAEGVRQRAARAVELLPDMARWQPVEAHHREIDVDAFGDLHVSTLSQQPWASALLLPAGYHTRPRERVARSSLPEVSR